MIESVHFKNFKVLRDATLPLGRFTLTVGPNGSGKSTALQALQAVGNMDSMQFEKILTAGLPRNSTEKIEVSIKWGPPYDRGVTRAYWVSGKALSPVHEGFPPTIKDPKPLAAYLAQVCIYSLDAPAIAAPVPLHPNMKLERNGGSLAGVLDRLRDQDPERFETLNEELKRWFPEYDRILFDTPSNGKRAFLLRTRDSRFAIPAADLSQGTSWLLLSLLSLICQILLLSSVWRSQTEGFIPDFCVKFKMLCTASVIQNPVAKSESLFR